MLDHLFDVSCKLLHISTSSVLSSFVPQLVNHFSQYGSPAMMGGDVDAASKGILGICCDDNQENTHLLVLDPHFTMDKTEKRYSTKEIQDQQFVKWVPLSSFDERSFYNLCLPLVAGR